jgi:Flp pilus assembly protein protease CpaA
MLRIASVLAIAFIYMLFDVFNKRNVPSTFAYFTLGYGFVLTLSYFNMSAVMTSSAVALAVLGVGYIVYRAGQIGAADVIELAALSLILPVQPVPVLASSFNQFGLPFAVTVIVAAGVVAMIIVPAYYLPRAKRMFKKPLSAFIDRKGAFKAVLIVVPYIAFVLFLEAEASINAVGLAILAAMMVGSSLLMLFEKPITDSMVELISIDKCDEGDIIAFNLMDKKDIDAIRKKVATFDRLLTRELIAQIKEKRIRSRLPVYRKALPFAVPLFAAVVISILLGNIIFFILPIL